MLFLGSPALIGLASIPAVPLGLLDAVEGALPRHRDVDLDAGIAAISAVLTRHRIAATTSPAVRAAVHLEG
ncbi:hypothetical protein AB0B57_03435 [Micromonospora sp. NPDC049101]|uniref:hypothetical protein n=1 Tax=Micromonospora sp. NPDC049101 TaxID=3155032 RepID=UPI0033D33DE2